MTDPLNVSGLHICTDILYLADQIRAIHTCFGQLAGP